MVNHLNVSIGNFRKKVLDKKNTIADKVFLISEAARHYIENMVEAVTKRYNSSIHVKLNWGSQDDVIAYATDRDVLYMNVNNTFVTSRNDRAMKLVIMKAIALHECGHLLFTDFHILISSKKVFIDQRKLFPAPKCPEYNEWQTDAVLMNDMQIQKWFKIWHTVQNSVEDGFIEWMILNIIPGDGKCLLSLREMQKEKDTSVKQQRQNGLKTPQILFNLILMLSKYGTVKMDVDDKQDPAIEELLKDYDLIAKATKEQRSYERTKLINELFCKLYKFFKEEKQKEQQSYQEGSDEQNDDSENNSDHDTQKNNKSNRDDSETGPDEQDSIPDPSNIDIPDDYIKDNINTGKGSVLNDNNIDKSLESTSDGAKNNQQRLDDMMKDDAPQDAKIPTPEDKRMADSIAEHIAQDEVKKEAEKALAKNLQDEAKKIDYSKYNQNVATTIVRKEPSEAAYKQYAMDENAIKYEVKKLVREIKNKIKDRQNGGKINGLYQGRYLDSHSLYRFDQRVLCKNDLPEDIPNMAFSLMLDASGSMLGHKETYARRTALLLYEFGLELNVPVMVYSHNCSSHSGVTMQALADYGSVDGKDKYRICDYSPNGCNRDGVALRFCSKKLSERQEETKICFIISDGLPSAYNSMTEAYADIKDCLIEYSKKGVKYITCGLGGDAARIKEIYQQNLSPKVKAEFLDCSDSSKLPIEVVRAIKELIK